MKKNRFVFGANDLYSYITDSLKFNKDEESLKKLKENNKNKTEKEDTDYENLTSLNTQAKNIEKNITKRVTLLLVTIPLVIFFSVVFYKTYQLIQKNGEREAVKKDTNATTNTKLGLAMDTTFKWRVLKDQEMQEIKSNVQELKTSLRSDMNQTLIAVDKKLQENSKAITKELQLMKQDFSRTKDEIISRLDLTSQEQRELNEKIDSQKKNILSIVKKTKSTPKNTPLGISLPELPPLKTDFAHKNKKVNLFKEKSTTFVENEQDEYVEVTESISIDAIDYETQEFSNSIKENNQSVAMPSFTLMPGFTKGILINGGEMPILAEGDDTSEAVPIFIRVNGDELIANDSSVNIDGCIIIATAKGSLSKKAAELRLSKISCNITDIDGNSYKVDKKIAGWVFDENGNYGVKGRLVSREKDIIKAGLPLAIVESMVKSLSMAIGNSNTNIVIPAGENPAAVNSQYMSGGLVQGAGKGASEVLRKFSDYYMKMLNSLNPTISIRAGREVTIAFKGGEKLELKKYDPINTEYFSEKEFDDE